MRFTKFVLPAVLPCLVLLAGMSAHAQINSPVPTNAYITFNGFEWAWASPLPPPGNGFTLAYQGTQGWRLPTTAELTLAPLATDFLFAGANVPFNGVDPVSGATFQSTNAAYTAAQSAGAVATPYFNSVLKHADWQDGLGQTYGPWAGMPGSKSYSDQLVIRDSANSTPEPGSIALLVGMGLSSAGFLVRRKKARKAA